MPIPNGIKREQIIEAIRRLDSGQQHAFGPSTRYELILDGKSYPPKAVVGVASEVLTGRPFGPDDFSSGKAKGQAIALLKDLGFEIRDRPPAWDLGPGQSPCVRVVDAWRDPEGCGAPADAKHR